MTFKEGKNLIVRIDISPLVDVVFLLVIFFSVSTTFIETSGLKLSLPESTSVTEKDSDEIIIFLTEEGKIFYQGSEWDIDKLAMKLKKDIKQAEKKFVIVKADEKAKHGDVVALMDAAKNAGAEGITIATRAKQRRNNSPPL